MIGTNTRSGNNFILPVIPVQGSQKLFWEQLKFTLNSCIRAGKVSILGTTLFPLYTGCIRGIKLSFSGVCGIKLSFFDEDSCSCRRKIQSYTEQLVNSDFLRRSSAVYLLNKVTANRPCVEV